MSQIIDAIYEEGVLKPLEPLHLKEHAKVRIQIATIEENSEPQECNLEQAKRIIALARASYEGLSEEEISMIESARFNNNLSFSNSGKSK